MSSRPSASVATIGLPIASASNAVIGVPSQSDGKTLRSNADSVARHVAPEAGEHEPIAEPEPRRLRLQVRQQRPFADQKEPRAAAARGRRGRPRRPGTSCPSIVQPGDGADRELVAADAELRSRRRRSRRPSAVGLNSSSGTPRYTTFTFDAGICRAPTTKSAVLFETASAMSVKGSSSRSATF